METANIIDGCALPRRQTPAQSPCTSDAGSLNDRDSSFLIQATRLLADSLDVETTLATVARLTVPHFGSWCVVDLFEHEQMRRIAIVCPNPTEQALADQLLVGWPPERDASTGIPSVVRTRRSVFTFPVTDDMLIKASQTPENLAILRALQIGSLMTIPLLARGQVLGAITYVSPDHGDSFSEHDLVLAEDLAARCAIAIDNSRLMRVAKDAKGHAEVANVAKMHFLSTMSHELRTPLNAIGGYAELLATGVRGVLTEPQLADVRRIQANQRHLLGLVEAVLSYTKLDAGHVEFDLENVILAGVIAEVERIVAPLIAAKEIACCGLKPQGQSRIVVRADRKRLRQILINLVANAIKYSSDGGTIDITYQSVGERVQIRIADKGIGIAPDQLERIFEPFVQVDEGLTRSSGGTGLGLAISQELAAGMGGELSVESVLGQGSVFILTLGRSRDRSTGSIRGGSSVDPLELAKATSVTAPSSGAGPSPAPGPDRDGAAP